MHRALLQSGARALCTSGSSPGRRILSGIQPTGALHLGNYLGAVQQWVDLQRPGTQTLYSLVDLHALTGWKGTGSEMREVVTECAITLLAAGIDPERSTLFVQSQVPQHAELMWLLSTRTQLGWLQRMTQFKVKRGEKQQDQAGVGLFTYPVLQAADILVYRATHVPVGDDQKQHLELARQIGQSANHRWGAGVFQLPETLLSAQGARVMSLTDGTSKMSKSDPNDSSRINLGDTPDQIARKMKRAKSDSIAGLSYDIAARPEVSNLVDMFACLTRSSPQEVCDTHGSMRMGDFKGALTELLVEKLGPISEQMQRLEKDRGYVHKVLEDGALRAAELAEETMGPVREAVGTRTPVSVRR